MFRFNRKIAVTLIIGTLILATAVPTFAEGRGGEKGDGAKITEKQDKGGGNNPQNLAKGDNRVSGGLPDFSEVPKDENRVSGGLPTQDKGSKDLDKLDTEKEKQRLEEAKKKVEEAKSGQGVKQLPAQDKKGAFGQSVSTIKKAQGLEAKTRGQIKALRHQLDNQIRHARSLQDYDALLLALDGMIAMQEDIAILQGNIRLSKTNWNQLMLDKKAGDKVAIEADLERILLDSQIRQDSLNKILADLQKILTDLNAPVESTQTKPSTEVVPAEEVEPLDDTKPVSDAEPTPSLDEPVAE